MSLGDKAAALTLAERAIAVNPIEKDARKLARLRLSFSPGWQRKREKPIAPSPLCRSFYRYLIRDRLVRALLLLPHCSGSIRCSIRSGTIRASKNRRRSERASCDDCACEIDCGAAI